MTMTAAGVRPVAGSRPEPRETPFLRLARQRADLTADWLLRSIRACGGKGSPLCYSRWFRPLSGWAFPYPETTGYLIPTLFAYARFAGRPEIDEVAIAQADWIRSLQYENGALPGGDLRYGRRRPPSVFNTGQMMLGLVAAADHTGRSDYLDAAAHAAQWLAGEVDPQAGTWTAHAYVQGFSPAYYSRVAWPMLEVECRRSDPVVRAAAARVLDTIAGWQIANGAFRNWEFFPGKPAFTHTIAYTIRGLWEGGQLLGADGAGLCEVATRSADVLRRRMERSGGLAGAYDRDWRGTTWYTCLTGNCQLAIIWMRIYETTGDARFLSAACKAIDFVMRRQRIRSIDPNVRGAIAGSSPFWGRYLMLRYPNWAAKFYLDALLEVHKHLSSLLESGPCAS